jgi:hypothetical protein
MHAGHALLFDLREPSGCDATNAGQFVHTLKAALLT